MQKGKYVVITLPGPVPERLRSWFTLTLHLYFNEAVSQIYANVLLSG